jgi:hypothetical protein
MVADSVPLPTEDDVTLQASALPGTLVYQLLFPYFIFTIIFNVFSINGS